MTDNKPIHELDREADLADFTDKIMNNQSTPRSTDKHENALEDVVLALKTKAVQTPPEDVKQRIKQRTQTVYQQTYSKKNTAPQTGLFAFFSRKQKDNYRSRSQQQRTRGIQLAIAAGVVTTILLFTMPPTEPSGTTGAATGNLWLPLGILILAGVVIGWLWFRNKD